MKILKIKLVNFQSYKNEEFQMNDVWSSSGKTGRVNPRS